MSRPLRIAYQGAWYHVMNRGLARNPIFVIDDHRLIFLDLFAEIHDRYQAEIHAYCLMKNHIRSPLPNRLTITKNMRLIVYLN
jgi:putative transposase